MGTNMIIGGCVGSTPIGALLKQTMPDYNALALEVINDGNTVAWYDSQDLATITKDGSNLVSLWKDKLLSGHDLVQETGAKMPVWSVNGILFDGIDDFLKTVPFTYNQPEQIFLVFKSKTITNGDFVFDGNADESGAITQRGTVPVEYIRAAAGSVAANLAGMTVDTISIVRVTFNGASSSLQIDNLTPQLSNYGSRNMGAITLAKYGNFAGNYGNVEFKELIFRKISDTDEDKAKLYYYLKNKHLPTTLILTPTGDSSGVAKMTLTVYATEILSLDEGAKFYTDIAGTENESSTWLVNQGGERTIYIKCTTGNPVLHLTDRNVKKWTWDSWANAPSIAGKIDTFYELQHIDIQGNNTLSGVVTDLVNLVYFEVRGENTLTGSVAKMLNVERIVNLGSGTWPDRGHNRLTGSITNLTKLKYLRVFGDVNTISGNITNLANLEYIQMDSSGLIEGDITLMTKLTMLDIVYQNVNSQITGDMSNLTNLYYVWLSGNANNVSGDITGLSGLITLWVVTPNTLSGNINATAMQTLNVQGANTISADLGLLLDTLQGNIVMNPCAVINYTPGGVWPNGTITINPGVGYGLSATEIDNMLIDMAASTALIGKTITLKGSNATRTSASDGAVATLTGVGRTNTLVLN